MGWSRGSALAEEVWTSVRASINQYDRKRLARKVIELFEAEDCDTIGECDTLVKDARAQGKYWGKKEDEGVLDVQPDPESEPEPAPKKKKK